MITSSSDNPKNSIDDEKNVAQGDLTTPWGIYIPPPKVSTATNLHEANRETNGVNTAKGINLAPHEKQHMGYVRIIDSKGKSFPCGFSRPVGVVIETVTCNKRSLSQMSGQSDVLNGEEENAIADMNGGGGDEEIPTNFDGEKEVQQKKTITETRLHPEEALFLQMRGQFQVMHKCRDETIEDNVDRKDVSLMDTQDLFCKMLPECKIPLAAYLAYAHLRSQGYNLIRFTKNRMSLLYSMQQFEHKSRRKLSLSIHKTIAGSGCEDGRTLATKQSSLKCTETINGPLDIAAENSSNTDAKHLIGERIADTDVEKKVGDDVVPTKSSMRKEGFRELVHKYSEDVSAAPPPFVISLESWNRSEDGIKNQKLELSYYAYNPNSCFRRSNPGLPDFGVAIMPHKFDDGQGPSFDVLASLVSLCESNVLEAAESEVRDIPLRVVTVADGGSVIAFGITRGDVPDISNQGRNVK